LAQMALENEDGCICAMRDVERYLELLKRSTGRVAGIVCVALTIVGFSPVIGPRIRLRTCVWCNQYKSGGMIQLVLELAFLKRVLMDQQVSRGRRLAQRR